MLGSDPRRRLGALGEALARRHLEARGLTVLDANFRTRHGEVDLVAADDRYLVFCEVKTRVLSGPPGELGPFAAIGARKQKRIRLMAREWLATRGSTGWEAKRESTGSPAKPESTGSPAKPESTGSPAGRGSTEFPTTRESTRRRPAELRFDAVGIVFDRQGRLISLEHLEDAF